MKHPIGGRANVAELLDRIELSLGLSEGALRGGTASGLECEQACELLRIWHGLEPVADRLKLLTFARTLAAGRPLA